MAPGATLTDRSQYNLRLRIMLGAWPARSQAPVRDVIGDIDPQQHRREPEPGDGILQMLVSEIHDRLPAFRPATEVRRGVCLDHDRRCKLCDTIGFCDGIQIMREPYAVCAVRHWREPSRQIGRSPD